MANAIIRWRVEPDAADRNQRWLRCGEVFDVAVLWADLR